MTRSDTYRLLIESTRNRILLLQDARGVHNSDTIPKFRRDHRTKLNQKRVIFSFKAEPFVQVSTNIK